MSKTQLQPDNIKDWDLSGGGGFTLSALEFSQDIQEQLNEVKRILAASEAKQEDTPFVDTPFVDTSSDRSGSEGITEGDTSVTSKTDQVLREKELVSEDSDKMGERKVVASENLSYHYYNAFPQEAKQYPTLLISKMTASPTVRSDFYHPGCPELDFDTY